jgi:hypothetical protein
LKACGREAPPGVPSDLANPNDVALNGCLKELGGIGHAHFLHHIGAMRFNRFYADFEPLTDFLIFKSGPYQLEYFLLTAR